MVGSEPRAHAPSVCRSLRSGAEINIPVQAATGTSLECIIPRQKALDLGLHCLLEDVNEGFDYFRLVNCKVGSSSYSIQLPDFVYPFFAFFCRIMFFPDAR